ncbi:MAG: hypothetical protein AAFX03_00960 [Pseudomonadota bacterium]
MIRFLIAATAALFAAATASADIRDVYTIRDIPVDERADTVIEAQQAAFAQARLIAARALVARITQPADRAAVGGVPIDLELAQTLASAVDVQEETRGGGRYLGVLSVVLNPQTVRPLLEQRGIPYLDTQAPLALLAPTSADNQIAWSTAWEAGRAATLAPYVTAADFYGPFATWDDMVVEATQVGAQRGIIANLRGLEGAYSVRLSLVTAGGASPIGSTQAVPDLDAAVVAARSVLERAWKNQALVGLGASRTFVEANVAYTSIVEWNTLRAALAQSPLVSDFSIKAISRGGAIVDFAFAGEIERFAAELRQRGVAIGVDENGWTLTSAISGAP